MGPDQLSSVMQTVSGKNKPVQESEDRWKDLRTKIEAQSEVTYSTARIWVSLCLERSRIKGAKLMIRMTESLLRPIRGMSWV
jgi:hypothetical protein